MSAALQGLDALRTRDARWYLDVYESDRASRIQMVAKRLWSENRARRDAYCRFWGLYSNLPLPGLTPRKYNERLNDLATSQAITWNGAAAVTDQYVAKITSQRPKVSFSTLGGNWELQQKSHLLEKFNDGIITDNEMYEAIGPLLEKDIGIFGTGIVKTYSDSDSDNARIIHERIFPWLVFCDDEEAQSGDPRCMYERRYIDRLQAMAMWPEFATQIAIVSRDTEDYDDHDSTNSWTDSVCVTECWHLPSGIRVRGGGRDTGDGLHCIVVGDVLVLEEPCTRYPFEFVYAEPPTNGIWGRGLVEQVRAIQYEINVITKMIRVAFKLGGSIRWMTESSTQLNFSKVSHDIIGGRIEYTGPTAPVAISPPTISAEVFQYLNTLWEKLFEVCGVSMMSATSSVPANDESGKARQLRLDTESERFQVAIHQYHNLYLRLARNQVLPLARELAEKNPNFRVKAMTRKTMQVVKASEALLDEEDMAMKLYAVSSFADEPEARLEQIQELVNSQNPLLSPQEGRRLINDPDIEEWQSLEDASYNLTMDMISDIVNHGKMAAPEPFMNLDETLKWAQLSRIKARRDGVPMERLKMLSDFILQTKSLIDQAKAASAPPPPPPQGGPPPGPQGGPPPNHPPMPPGGPPQTPMPMAA